MKNSTALDAESHIRSLLNMRQFLLILSIYTIVFATGLDIDYTKTQEFRNKIDRVERWRSLVDYVMRQQGYNIDADKVLALIAQESGGNALIAADDKWGSTGLMQVGPRSWTPTQEYLKNPTINIQWGLWFLNGSLKLADGDWYMALRYYNCGKIRADESSCGAEYAKNILEFWYPYFKTYVAENVSGILITDKCLVFMLRYDKDYSRFC